MCLLRLHIFSELIRKGLGLSEECFDSRRLLRLVQYQLAGRIDDQLLQTVDGFLALRVKGADGIHFIAPHLNADRIVLRQRKHVENPASYSKLSDIFHLIFLLIPHTYKVRRQFLQIHRVSRCDLPDTAPHLIRRRHSVHQGIVRRDQRHALFLTNCL